ncbi:MAG: c-type cytochrome [Planctomycetes bacterium]|nr:c-type cytochrome [Planctomycetota bacterium]
MFEKRLGSRSWISLFLGASLILVGPSWPAVAPAAEFVRGNADNTGDRDITDAIFILTFLFLGGTPPACEPIADVDSSGVVDVTDAVNLLSFLFLGLGTIEPLTPADLLACRGLDPRAVARGQMVYKTAVEFSSYACSSCHHPVPDSQSDILLPGYSLFDALRRPNYKGGQRANFLGAANVCRTDWMLADVWSENAQEFKDLMAYLESQSPPDPAPALVFEISPPAKTGPATGDAAKGCELFNRSCMACHGKNAVGTAIPGTDTLLDIAQPPFDPIDPIRDNPDELRKKIRLSGPIGTVYGDILIGGIMPFWSKDKISDAQVEHLVSFILATREQVRTGKPPIECP